MNRGSRGHRAWSSGQSDGFNEAPIHESGKLADCEYHRPMATSFNEAPIHESGKYD